jgi:predicted ABC-type ATPase
MSRPVFLVIAGPNGAGKTTAAEPLLEVMGIEEYVNADVIAQGFSMLHAEAMAFTAGRLALQRIHTLIDEERSFAFETTLASRSVAGLISRAKAGRFQTRLLFLALSSPELAIDRVAHRVEMGGHGIPKETIVRRYRRGLRNFFATYEGMVDEWRFYDNSSELSLLATGPNIRGDIDRLNAYRKQIHD